MTSDIEMLLPAGKLGVIFKGDPPVIKGFKENSPMRGKMEIGYVVKALYLSDGIIFDNLNATELITKLQKYSHDEERKLLLKAPTDDRITWCKATETAASLSHLCSLSELMNVRYTVDKSESGSDTNTAMSDEDSEENELDLTPNVPPKPDREIMIKSMDVPAGKLGLFFKERKQVSVLKISDVSRMKNTLQIGDIVETLKLPDSDTFRHFTAGEFSRKLEASANIKGRVIIIKREENIVGISTMKTVKLPRGKLGVTFKGKRETYVSKVSETSSMNNNVQVGDVVDTLELQDGERYCKFTSNGLAMKLNETKRSEGRLFIVKRTEDERGLGKKLPELTNIEIPDGKLGVGFKGSVEVYITKVSDISPMKDLLKVGKVVDTLALPDGTKFRNFTSVELGKKLRDTSDMKGRVIVLVA